MTPARNPRPGRALPTVWILALLIHAGTGRLASAQRSPADALAAMKTPADIEVTLFASEPDILKPTSIDIDDRGRVWVTEAVNYRVFKNPVVRPEGDRIRVLEDTDGDGRADTARTFYQDESLQTPISIAVLGERVYVCQSPDLFYLEDTDGDGAADRRTVILTGFKGVDHDHAIHGVNYGPDGLLYMSNGDAGLDVTDKEGNRSEAGKWGLPLPAATVLRTDLEGNRLEALASGLRNPLEPAVDSFGNVFISDNDDDGNEQCRICFIMDGGDYGYYPRREGDRRLNSIHWNEDRPGIVPMILRTGMGSPVGLTVYEGDLLPDRVRGTMLHADAGPGVVRSISYTPRGASFEAEIEILLSCPDDRWFRPVDVCAAPDGSVLVADWYDPGVGGHNLGDRVSGRIYRLAPKGKRYDQPAPEYGDVHGLARAMASPNTATKFNAHRAIADNPRGTEMLRALWYGRDPVVRARALWLLALLRADSVERLVMEAAGSDDPRFRTLAVRIAAGRQTTPDLSRRVASMLAEDPDPAVRRELLLKLRYMDIGDEEILRALVPAYDGADRHYREAVGLALRGREAEAFAEIDAAFADDDPRKLELAVQLHPPASVTLAERILKDSASTGAARLAALRIADAEGSAESAALLVGALAGDSAPLRDAALSILTWDGGREWKSHVRDDPRTETFLRTAITDDAMRGVAVRLIEQMNIVSFIPVMNDLAADDTVPKAERRALITTLGALDSGMAVRGLARLIGDPDEELATAAVRALAAQRRDDALQTLGDAFLYADISPALRRSMIGIMGAQKSGALLLLEITERGELPEYLRLNVAEATHASPFEDIRMMAEQLLPAERTSAGEALPPVSELVKMNGDAARGERVFFAEQGPQCFKCHAVGDRGREVGPALTKIGSKLAPESLFESILNPSAAIQHEYEVWLIRTRANGYLNGYIRSEDDHHLTLMDATGNVTRVRTDEITERRKSTVSLMPTGLSGGMSRQDLVDLVRWLGTLK